MGRIVLKLGGKKDDEVRVSGSSEFVNEKHAKLFATFILTFTPAASIIKKDATTQSIHHITRENLATGHYP